MIDIKVKKICIMCGKQFQTWFPNRMVCNDCLLYMLGIDKDDKVQIYLNGEKMAIWDDTN